MTKTHEPFPLHEWRARLALSQPQAAKLLGLSLSAYRRAEWKAEDTGECSCTVAILARLIEEQRGKAA